MLKKIFIIATTIFVLALVFEGAYWFVFKKENNFHLPTSNSSSKKEEIPSKIFALSDEKVISDIKIDKNEDIIYYYVPAYKAIYKSAFNGKGQRIVSKLEQTQIKRLIWSPNGKKIIYQNTDGFFLKDMEKGEAIKLKKGLDLVVWNNLGDKIIYKYYNSDTKERSLNLANPDGNFWQRMALLAWPKMEIQSVPQSVLVSFWNYPQKKALSSLKVISLAGKEVQTIFTGLWGADYLWSPNGEKVLISSVDKNNQLHLGVADGSGKNYRDLNFSTLVSKCVWSNDNQNIYCARPTNISSESILPDDYLSRKIKTRDDFWKINIMTGQSKRLLKMEEIRGDYDASDMQISSDEDYLFFINRQDEKIYGLQL